MISALRVWIFLLMQKRSPTVVHVLVVYEQKEEALCTGPRSSGGYTRRADWRKFSEILAKASSLSANLKYRN